MTSGDNLKEQERTKLHNTIWKIANELRGSVDGWDFKAYVLGFLFYRFISENLVNYINAEERKTGVDDFNYAELSDDQAEFGRADTVNDKGFYILPSELFENVRKRAKNDENLNETLSKIFRNIEQSAKGFDSEDDFRGLFDDLDVNSNKLGPTVTRRNERLVKLMNAIGELELGKFEDNTIDAFGDAYEYLMTMYAGNAGKSGGEFFTPQEVSELLAKITVVGKTSVNKVYDPAAGSGSLLLKFAKVLGKLGRKAPPPQPSRATASRRAPKCSLPAGREAQVTAVTWAARAAAPRATALAALATGRAEPDRKSVV